MAKINDKDRSVLYARANNLAAQAVEIDQWADQLVQQQMLERGAAHRQLAGMMHAEARVCREWADQPGDD